MGVKRKVIKGGLDFNFQEKLDNIEKYPLVLEQAQRMYLMQVTEKATFAEIARRFGVAHTTASRYVNAFKRVAPDCHELPGLHEALGFAHYQMRRLLIMRQGGQQDKNGKVIIPGADGVEEDLKITAELRRWQDTINELTGLTKPESALYITVINQAIIKLEAVLKKHIKDPVVIEAIARELQGGEVFEALQTPVTPVIQEVNHVTEPAG